MSLAPLLDASPVIQVHAFAAFAAFGLGLVQFAAPRGTLPHRTVGWLWVALLAIIAISSFWIHEDQDVGAVQPDPSVVDLCADHAAARAVWAAHRHHVRRIARACPGYSSARSWSPAHLRSGPVASCMPSCSGIDVIKMFVWPHAEEGALAPSRSMEASPDDGPLHPSRRIASQCSSG